MVGVRLHEDVAGGRAEAVRGRPGDVGAGWGGSALCFELVRADEACLAFAVGDATWRGLPGAGRVHVGAVSPLTGGYTEGALGGDFAWALAAAGIAGLALTGRAPAGSVLVLEADGKGVGVRLVQAPAETARQLVAWARAEAPGAQHVAAVANGPGARRGVPYGLLLSGDAVASATGRGGLGTRLAALGLSGVVLCAPADTRDVPGGERDASGWLARAAAKSPRLKARARTGTFELFAAFAARGDARAALSSWGRAARASEVEHHGCKGCPTPCGMVFERGDKAAKGGARFGAAHALGEGLGLDAFDDVLAVLEACDAEGVDAREAAAVLALVAEALEAGGAEWLARALAGDGTDPLGPLFAVRRGDRASLIEGVRALPALGLVELAGVLDAARVESQPAFAARIVACGGQAARRESDVAANLGQVVSSAGNDPMRSFPFTVARSRSAGRPEAEGALPGAFDPLAGLAPDVLDPRRPTGKGRLVAWHEDLAAAIDIAGFCSFSAAGLLVDGAVTLDELARLVAPAAVLEPGAEGHAWLTAGRALVAARRAFAAAHRGPQELPDWARAELAHPEVLRAYLEVRGEGARADALGLAVGAPQGAEAGADAASSPPVSEDAGSVTLVLHGALADVFGAERVAFAVDGPLALGVFLGRIAAQAPRARALLVGDRGRVVPSVWRAGQLVRADDLVGAGDALELVMVIGGG